MVAGGSEDLNIFNFLMCQLIGPLRILLIVCSMYASATVDMWLSLVLCSVSCVVLHLWGDNNKLGLQIGESPGVCCAVIVPLNQNPNFP